MFSQYFQRAIATTAVALLLTATFVTAQTNQPALKITNPAGDEKDYNRNTPTIELDRSSAFQRRGGAISLAAQSAQTGKAARQRTAGHEGVNAFSRRTQVATVSTLASLPIGDGDGDINEVEPNDTVAQNVSLPVNVFGEMSVNGDVDFFAFQALAGQQITVEAFAARVSRSLLIADIALFDADGNQLASSLGSDVDDPLLRFTPTTDQTLIVGITDADDLGGPRFDYLLNITRGVDVDEVEPNGTTAQVLGQVPTTIFGEISSPSDIDFYSFTGTAGQTLIVDVDAEVLGSNLDAEINLTDSATGQEYFFNDQFDGDDPRFNIVLPATGTYVIGIGSFAASSSGFYRMNVSLVSGAGAPTLTSVTKLAKKLLQVTGVGFAAGATVNVNGVNHHTTFVSDGTLTAKAKLKTGDVVTVSNPPDRRRSNPIVVP